jgi:hypothetical protein
MAATRSPSESVPGEQVIAASDRKFALTAHMGQEAEVNYCWHPLYGRRVKVRDVEQSSGGCLVHVEVSPDVVKIVVARMLDRVACSAMELGEPRGIPAVLCELDQQLVDRFLRANTADDSIVRESEMNASHP